MFGLFRKFKEGLAKTVGAIASKTLGLFSGRAIDASSLESLEEALYTADFGVATTEEILAEIKDAAKRDKELRGQQAAAIGAAVLSRVLAGSEGTLTRAAKAPTTIVMIGVNGSGKTTTTAKLAWLLKQQGHSVTVAACDTFRAAAVEQLRAWAQKLDLELIASQPGADAAAVAFDAWQAASARGRDFLLIDTAGRLHTKSNLMEELAKIRRVLQKHDPAAPHHRWLVVDGSLGTNSIEQARVFHQSFGLTGLIVTKLDGTAKGGVLAAIARWCAADNRPLAVYFIGVGEQLADLQPFDAREFAQALVQ